MTNPAVAVVSWRLDPTDPRLNDPAHDVERIDQLSPLPYLINNRRALLYTIGDLAAMLGRSPVTLRAWERKGHIPPTELRRNFEDTLGSRRLYTRAQVLGIVAAARKHNMLTLYQINRIPPEFRLDCDQYFIDPLAA